MAEIVLFALAAVVVSGLAGFWLRRRLPNWGRIRTIALAALPIPGLLWALCLVLLVVAFTSSKEACGVDACGMLAMAAIYVAGYNLVVYLLCLLPAALGLRLAEKRMRRPATEFE